MRNRNPRQFLVYLTLTILLIGGISFAGFTWGVEGETDEGTQAIEARRTADQDQTETESEELSTLQEDEDEEECEAEVSGYTPRTNGGNNGGETPADDSTRPANTEDENQTPTNGDNSTGEPVGGEEETRERLAEAGLEVNKPNDCGNQRFQDVDGGCTSVAGLPQHAIDRSAEIDQAVGGNLVITGGTERGHTPGPNGHGAGNNVVDYRTTPELQSYVEQHAVSTSGEGNRNVYYTLDNGDYVIHEDIGGKNDHFHFRMSGRLAGNSSAFNIKIKDFVDNFKKIISKIYIKTAFALDADKDRVISVTRGEDIAGINLDTSTTQEISSFVESLSAEEVNQVFGSISSRTTIREIISTLTDNKAPYTSETETFTSLNNIFENLNVANLSRVIDSLPTTNMGGIVRFLNDNSAENILTNLSDTQLTRTLSRLNDDDLNNLLTNIYQSGETIEGLGIYDEIISSISRGSLDDIVDNLGDGAINSIFGYLNDDTLESVMNILGDDKSTLNHLFNELSEGGMNNVLEYLNGSGNGFVDQIIGNLETNAVVNIFNQGISETVDSLMGGLSDNVLGDMLTDLSLDGALDDLDTQIQDMEELMERDLTEDILNDGVIDGVMGEDTEDLFPGQDDLEDQLDPTGQTTSLYVPVVEQNGELMQLTDSTNQETREIKDLSIQICTHLKAIRRIQQRLELKEVQDASVRRARSTEIEKYRQAVFGENGLIKTGYKTLNTEGDEQSGPLFVENNKKYWKVNELEAEENVKDDIKESKSPYKDELVRLIGSGNPFSINSTLSDQDLENLDPSKNSGSNPTGEENADGTETANTKNNKDFSFRNMPFVGRILKPVDKVLAFIFGDKILAAEEAGGNNFSESSNYWGSWLKLIEPQNNRIGSLANALSKRERDINNNVSSAIEDAANGQGFLPVRECAEKTADGQSCLIWRTIQPSIIVKETASQAIGSRLRQYEQAKDMGDLAPGNEPNVEEIATNNPSEGGGGAEGFGMTGPGGIADTYEGLLSDEEVNTPEGLEGDTGSDNQGGGLSTGDGGDDGDYGNGGLSWDSIIDIVSGTFESSESGDDVNLDDVTALRTEIDNLLSKLGIDITTFRLRKPWIVFKANAKANDVSLIYWYSPNAISCTTNNKWVAGDTTTTVKENGVDLGLYGKQEVTIKAGESATYKIKCTNKSLTGEDRVTKRELTVSKN